MSNITNIHDILPYDGKNKPLSGQVLLTYTSKEVKPNQDGTPSGIMKDYGIKAGTKPQNSCVSVPSIPDADILANINSLIPYVQDFLHEERRAILRDAVLKATGMKQAGLSENWTLKTEDVSLAAILSKLASDNAGGAGRFSKAVLSDWFDAVAAPVLLLGMLTKKGYPADLPEDSPAMLQFIKILEAVKDSLSEVVFSKKKPGADTLTKIDLILLRLSDNGINAESDTTLKLIAEKVKSWKESADAINWEDAL